MHRTRTLTGTLARTLACTLVAGLALPSAAQTATIIVDGNARTINGDSSIFNGVGFRSVRDDAAKTITFYFKGNLKVDLPFPMRFVVQNADYPVRLIVGNDAEFPGGLQLVAGTAGGGAPGAAGEGGAVSVGLQGDGIGYVPNGGFGGVSNCSGLHYAAGGGARGFLNFGAENAQPGKPGTAGSNGSPGVNQNPLSPGFGLGGSAGAGAAIQPRQRQSYEPSGGAGGEYGFASGSNGGHGVNGLSGDPQFASLPGSTGGDATNPSNPHKASLSPLLVAGNGGGSGAGGGGGGPGNGGDGGTSGSAGGGGGSTFCDRGGDGGNGGTGGGGRPGGNSGAGGNGQPGGAGGGAIEFSALGKLTISGGLLDASGQSANGTRIAGSAGLPGTFGYNGGPGMPGQVVNTPAGNGGNGGNGGKGGDSGKGGDGGSGGLGTGGSGGTVFVSATELNFTGTFDVRGGTNGAGLPRADSGRAIVSYNHKFAGALTASPSEDNGPLLTLPGMVPEASQASPYINGGPVVPYIAGLVGGAAVAGVIPGLKATTMVNPATLPPNTVAALLMLNTDVPGMTYDKTKYRALLFLNYSPSPDPQAFFIGLGGLPFHNFLYTFGWANDPRFGGTLGPEFIQVLGDAVYVTLVPIAQLNQNLAGIGGYFRNAANTGTELVITDSTTFGVGISKMLTVQRKVCTGDFNSDGLVDDADFQIFVVGYDILDCADASMPAGCPTDITRDGFVDDADFQKFVVAYDALLCP
ncbi:MAG: hypothetical protein JSS51_11225 [Planctomycetes bacterium]|nr:hypothetical protein [Planctomycetota bacterium]